MPCQVPRAGSPSSTGIETELAKDIEGDDIKGNDSESSADGRVRRGERNRTRGIVGANDVRHHRLSGGTIDRPEA